MIYRQFLPYVYNIGSPKLRRRLFEMLPLRLFKDMTRTVDTLDLESRKIYEEKKSALEKGDEAISQLVSHGKDILSVLRKLLRPFPCQLHHSE